MVGVHLWYVQGEVAYGHLGATSRIGYELMASLRAVRVRDRAASRRGAVAGPRGRARPIPMTMKADGLGRFKQGWATGTRQAYLCGKVLQPDAYRKPGRRTPASNRATFPHTDKASSARSTARPFGEVTAVFSTRVYDALNRHKDYAGASATLGAIVDRLAPHASTLLDVGCGTGQHLSHLCGRFAVEGLDREPADARGRTRSMPRRAIPPGFTRRVHPRQTLRHRHVPVRVDRLRERRSRASVERP